MTLSQLFNILNIYAMAIWAIAIFAPNWSITRKIMSSLLFLIPLICLYIYFLVVTFDFESITVLSDFNLENIALLFSQEGTAGAGWIHFLTMDLFVGRWIYWQGQEKKIWTVHSLLLCLFLGPVGLLSHIITATFFGNNNNDDSDNDDPETKKHSNVVS